MRLRSFSLGARERGVTQSAASQAVQQLEADLHAQLLDRSKRPFALTPSGEKLYEAGREILRRYEQVRAEITVGRHRITGVVRVAAIYSVGLHGMSEAMQRFLSLHPGTRVRLECLHPRKVVEAVAADEVDLGVMSYPPVGRGLVTVPLREERMVLVCPPAHRLARRHSVAAADLEGESFVAFDADLSIRKAVDRALRNRGVRVHVVMELDNVETIKQAIRIGTGVGILPEPTVTKDVGVRNLSAVPIDLPELVRPIGVLYRKQKPRTPAAARFLEILRETAQPGERRDATS